MRVVDLSAAPALAATIADRCWSEWWTESDVTCAEYHAAVAAMSEAQGVPIALVAIDDHGDFLGSTLLIENDLPARADLDRDWLTCVRQSGLCCLLVARFPG